MAKENKITESYRIDLRCANCGKKNYNTAIPKGMTIEEFGEKENPLCTTCGCPLIKTKTKKK